MIKKPCGARPRCRTGLEDQMRIHLPVSFCAFVRQAYVPVSTGWRMSEGNKMVQFLLRGKTQKNHTADSDTSKPQTHNCCHRALDITPGHTTTDLQSHPTSLCAVSLTANTNPLALGNSSFCLTYCQCEYDSYSHLQANILLAWLWYRLSIMYTFYDCPTCYRKWWVLEQITP